MMDHQFKPGRLFMLFNSVVEIVAEPDILVKTVDDDGVLFTRMTRLSNLEPMNDVVITKATTSAS